VHFHQVGGVRQHSRICLHAELFAWLAPASFVCRPLSSAAFAAALTFWFCRPCVVDAEFRIACGASPHACAGRAQTPGRLRRGHIGQEKTAMKSIYPSANPEMLTGGTYTQAALMLNTLAEEKNRLRQQERT
jgi:hypothetical protein